MQGQSTIVGLRLPLGYQQIVSATLVAATKLTLPTPPVSGYPASYVMIQNNGTQNVRWRDDGVAPTATVGMLLPFGSELDYYGDLANIQFIYVASGAILDINYYA